MYNIEIYIRHAFPFLLDKGMYWELWSLYSYIVTTRLIGEAYIVIFFFFRVQSVLIIERYTPAWQSR
jgi:hypothetical protein